MYSGVDLDVTTTIASRNSPPRVVVVFLMPTAINVYICSAAAAAALWKMYNKKSPASDERERVCRRCIIWNMCLCTYYVVKRDPYQRTRSCESARKKWMLKCLWWKTNQYNRKWCILYTVVLRAGDLAMIKVILARARARLSSTSNYYMRV